MGDINPDHLHPEARRRFVAMSQDPEYRRLRISPVSFWRSYTRQVQLYWGWTHHIPGYNRAAPPGTSNHEDMYEGRPGSTAIDQHPTFRTNSNYLAMERLANRYGLFRTISSERWHFEPAGWWAGVNFKNTGPVLGHPDLSNHPGPTPQPTQRRLFMYLTEEEEKRLLKNTDDIHLALFDKSNPSDPGMTYKMKWIEERTRKLPELFDYDKDAPWWSRLRTMVGRITKNAVEGSE